ncbi:right-handed parallel beta-helix repeat-containing protein [Pseudomonadota bacterium]
MAAKARTSIKNLSLAIFLVFMTTVVYGLDFPHVPSNPILPDIGCLSCHDLHGSAGSLLKSSVPNPDMDGDNTEANNLCWSCHTGPGLAPYRVPHSSDQISLKHGVWNIECKDCHNPHNQPQIQTYGSAAFLATGTLTAVTSSANSTLTDSSANWTVDEHAGRVVFPDANARDRRGIPIGDLSYRILSNTATTLTLDGVVNIGYVAAGDTYGIVYGKIIRNEILVPGTSTWKTVKFFAQTGANSFADDDATLDGVCQVCHTKTGHFRNDGTGPDQMHTNADRGDLTGTAGENCTEKCHLHIGGFGHGKGNTDVTLCIECHGHEEGTIYDPDGTYPYYPNGSTLTSRGFGSVIPHTTHTESWHTDGADWETTKPAGAGDDDLRGPGIYCSWCHNTANMPTFRIDGTYAADDTNADGEVSLDETSICATCHSPGGDYNGVDSTDGSVGAKDNWHSEGIYDADYNFKPGKEKWCAGCHDKDPSHIVIPDRGIDITAPKVIGDETEEFKYGTGWGFYKTGHGTPSSTTLPASGGVKAGPDKSCTYCHQSIRTHIDGNHRTYDCSDGCDSAEYSASYRMRKFSGSEPMAMPRAQYNGVNPTDFDLCLRSGCHGDAQAAFVDDTNLDTNFREGTTNYHEYHLSFYFANLTRADWATSGAYNNRLTCIVCHNPHGTKNHTMIRTGELTDRDPFGIWYWNTAYGSPGLYPPPNPDNITLGASSYSLLQGNSVNGYCATHCHNDSGGYNYISRTPFQNTDMAPILKWGEKVGFKADGVEPDVAEAGAEFEFVVQYLDYDDDAPTSIFLWVDADDDGTYEDIASEKHTLTTTEASPIYGGGVHYTAAVTLNKAGDNVIKYKFTATDADGTATGEPTADSSLIILNAKPTLEWTQEDERYTSDGVHSDNGANGGTYQFRIKYSDSDTGDTCPASGSADIQVWIDVDDDGYEAGEKFNMLQVDGDADCTDGKLYYYDAVLSATGSHNYKFYASDGSDAATGTPATADSTVTVAADGNTVPVLSWATEDCLVDGVNPPVGANGANGTSFEFKIKYTDEDNQCPTGGGSADIQVWIDEDKSSTYSAGEKHNLSPVDGDADCTTSGSGKLYNITGLTLAVNQDVPFEFHATDGVAADNAVGTPVVTGGAVDVYSALTVKASGGDYTSVQAAIAALAGNTTLVVDSGSYGAVSFSYGSDNNWTIISACGADLTSIVGGGSNGVNIANGLNTVFDGFSFTGSVDGISTNGGSLTVKNSKMHGNTSNGAYLQTDVILENVEVYNNSSVGIYTNGGTHTFTDLTVRNNSATSSGAGIYWQNLTGPATVTNLTVKDNTTTTSGGGMSNNGGTVNVTNCTITGNSSGTGAGAWYVGSGTVSLTNCVVANNTATTLAGGFYPNSGSVTINNSTLVNNVASGGSGGLIYSQSGTVVISNSIIWGNSASSLGQVIYSNGGSASLTDIIVQNSWDDDYTNEPHFRSSNITFAFSGYGSDEDPGFMDAANNDFKVKGYSKAINNAGAGATATDRDGTTRTDPDLGAYEYVADGAGAEVPTLAWTGETDFTADGVNPDSAIGGSSFEFRVDYTDAEGAAPASIELWIDEDSDGTMEPTEKYAMAAVGGGGQYGDGDYTNGERYTKTLTLANPGGGDKNYRIRASDGYTLATGDPADINTVTVNNRVPTVAWPGDTNYESDGVHPDAADSGDNFTFRVMYTDADNTAPIIAQAWIDENDTMFYDSGEYFDMAVETPDASQYRDGDYSNGEYFTFTKAITKAGDGRQYYRFAFSDGVDDATGDPSSLALASERYSRTFTVNEYKTTGVSADATPASETTVDVAMAYTGDENNDNSLKVEYGVNPADTNGWSTFATATHPTSPYSPTITGLTSGESYDVKMTFTDADGVLGTVSSTDTFVMPIYAITPGTATAVVATENSILVTMPYTNDGDNDSTYTVKYRVNSPQGSWVDSGTNPKANAPSPATHTITNLTYSEVYDVQVTYNDPDGGGATQVVTGVALPVIYTVCPDTPATCQTDSIQSAIDSATSGETVLVFAVGSPYSENIVLNANDDGVTVKSDSGFGSVTIQGVDAATDQPVVTFSTGVTSSTILDGFVIDNQTEGTNNSTGILIEEGAAPTVKNTVVAGNSVHVTNSNLGGGISITKGGLTLQDSRVGSTTASAGNGGEYGGGIYAKTTADGPYTLTISNSTIRYNTSNVYGGGVHVSGFNGDVDIDDLTLSNNAGTNAGGIYITGANVSNADITNSTISNNSALTGYGGGIYTDVPLTVEDSTITANVIVNTSRRGGGIYVNGVTSSLAMTNSTITNHTMPSSGSGGAIYVNNADTVTPLDISNSTISGNVAATGAGIYLYYADNQSKLTNVEISSNSTFSSYAGGIYVNASPLSIANSTISSNTSTSYGAGIYIMGAATVLDMVDSFVNSNTTDLSGTRNGGGIYSNAATMNITNSTIASNTAYTNGGGIYSFGASTLTMTNSYLKGNQTYGPGGGIYNPSAGSVTLTNVMATGNSAGNASYENGGVIYNLGTLTIYSSTLAGNYAYGLGGGFYSNGGTVDVENSIVWSNVADGGGATGPNYNLANSPTITVDYSNFGAWAGGGTGNIDADPLFVTPDVAGSDDAKAGGDYRLQSASPSVDVGGGGSVPADDIEGEARPYDGDGDTTATVDMGADEMTTGNQAPTIDWEGSANYTADGVDPDSASSGSAFTFKVKYTDLDNHVPGTIYVWVDEDDSGTFENPAERTALTVAGGEDGNYANGEIYETNPALTLTTVGNLDYYFEASDGWLDATGAPASIRTVQVSNTVPATPSNSTPAGSATNVSVTPVLTGSAFSDSDPGSSHLNSQWQVDNDSDFSSITYDSGTVTDLTSHTVATSLDASTVYYWRVRYRDNLSAWSAAYSTGTSFTTSTAPNTPSNSTPADATPGVIETPTLTSSAFSDPNTDTHQASQWQVDNDSDFSSITYDSGSVGDLLSHAVGSALPRGVTYYWRVRHQDSKNAWSAYSSSTTFTVNQVPNTPSNNTPADTATGVSLTPTLTTLAFSDPDGGDTHAASQWQVDDNSDFSSITDDSGEVGDLVSHTVGSSLVGNQTYYWRVRHKDNRGEWSAYSSSTSFTTQTNAPDTPTNSTPTDAATAIGLKPALTASAFSDIDVGQTHQNSQWQIDDNSDFSSITYDSGTVSDLESHTVGSSLGGTTLYYWRVRYQDSNNEWSSYSSNTTFTTEAAPTLVCDSELTPNHTIPTAISAASNGDILEICAGAAASFYAVQVDFGGKAISLRSDGGAGAVTLTGSGGNAPVVKFENGETVTSILDGFTIDNSGASSITRGIYVYGASPTIKNSIITGNVANNIGLSATECEGGGGGCIINGSPIIDNVTIKNNSAANRHGCGLYIMNGAGGATITNSTIGGTVTGDGNKCTNGDGGGIYFKNSTSGTLSITDSNIQYNSSSSEGGGLYIMANTNATIIDNTTILNNSSNDEGGGIYLNSTDVDVDDSEIEYNSAGATGGAGVYLWFGDNTSTFDNTIVSNNSGGANVYGGGIYANTTSFDLNNSTVNSNTAGINRSGGGVYISSSSARNVSINNTTINSNSSGSGGGGGMYMIYGGATVSMSKSTVKGNSTSSGSGGGIYNNSGILNITNSVIAGNQATTDYRYGGGIYNHGQLNLYFSTIADNYAYYAGGLYAYGNTTDDVTGDTVKNSIIWGNDAVVGVEVFGTIETEYLLEMSSDPSFTTRDPASSGTATTGGVYTLQSFSNAIDTGDATNKPAGDDDIVGNTRPTDIAGKGDGSDDYDKGAYEYQP